jgi:hypothetical protein
MNTIDEKQLAVKSQVVLTNAAELAVGIILNVVGNDVADNINGTRVGSTMLNNIIQARFQHSLNLN